MEVQSPIVFSTSGLNNSDQFEAYRAFMAPVIDVEPVESLDGPFSTEHRVWDLGTTVMTRAVLPPVERRFRHLRKEPLDHWCVVLCDSPEPGERHIGIRSLARQFEMSANDRGVLSLYLPRDLYPAMAGLIDAAEGDLPPTGLTTLLADYLSALERRLPLMSNEEMSTIAGATSTIVAACLAPNADRLEEAAPLTSWTLVERARRAIRDNLGRPDFSPDELCRMIGTSRSRLYRLFEPFGGVTRYMQRQRLRTARQLLTMPNVVIPVARIAEQVGFLDLSSFSRAFRREFNLSPTDMRSAGILGLPIDESPVAPELSPSADASILMRSLRALRG